MFLRFPTTNSLVSSTFILQKLSLRQVCRWDSFILQWIYVFRRKSISFCQVLCCYYVNIIRCPNYFSTIGFVCVFLCLASYHFLSLLCWFCIGPRNYSLGTLINNNRIIIFIIIIIIILILRKYYFPPVIFDFTMALHYPLSMLFRM
jgi:hypothetical protein